MHKFNTLHIAMVAVAALALFGCAMVTEPEATEETVSTITATFADDQTKTTLQDGGTTVYWEPGDQVKVFYGEAGSCYTSTLEESSVISVFKGTLINIIGSTTEKPGSRTIWAVYPYSESATSDGESVTTVLPVNQAGKAGSFGKGANVSIAKSESSYLSFYNVCGGVRFTVTRSDITDVVFESLGRESIAGQIKAAFNEDLPVVQEVVDGSYSITLTAPEGGTFEEGEWYYIVALPGTLASGFKMTFNTATQYATLKSTKSKTISRGIFGSIADADEGLNFKDKGTPDPEYVDLGLSVKWATFDLGATKPEEFGDYYAWGETQGSESFLWNADWSSYKWCNGSSKSLTKYNTDSEYGTVDHKTVLDLDDDAAHAIWGDGWRIPTEEEWQELAENCSFVHTKYSGFYGYIVTSTKEGYKDKSIFLSTSYYWSSSLNRFLPETVNAAYVQEGVLDSGSLSRCTFGRGSRISVRPVYGEFMPVTELISLSEHVGITVGGTYQWKVYIRPLNATYPDLRWISSNTKVATVSETGLLTGINPGTCTITVYASSGVKTEFDVTVFPECVDLGLSVYWANINVGASKPEEFGDYYAWGETQGYKEGKTYFEWKTYKYCDNGNYKSQTKYNSDSEYGIVDHKTVLEEEDDVAHVKWGDGWRMPTYDEWVELRNNCNWSRSNVNGVYGALVTSRKNGESIFLPATGSIHEDDFIYAGERGFYWSSTVYDPAIAAWYINYDNYGTVIHEYGRCYGMAVRPVMPK